MWSAKVHWKRGHLPWSVGKKYIQKIPLLPETSRTEKSGDIPQRFFWCFLKGQSYENIHTVYLNLIILATTFNYLKLVKA